MNLSTPLVPQTFCGCFERDLVVFLFCFLSFLSYKQRFLGCLGGWRARSWWRCPLLWFVCLFVLLPLPVASPRGGTASLRVHLASGSGYFFFPSSVFPCYLRITFRGIFVSLVNNLFCHFSFLSLSFVFSLVQCTCWVAGVRILCLSCLSYPVSIIRCHVISLSFPYQESPPHKRFLVGCSSPFTRLAQQRTALHAWCWRCLPGQ